MVAVTPVARKFVCCTTNCSFGRSALAVATASAGSPVTKPHFSYFPIFHVCSTSKQRTPLPSSLLSALFVLGLLFFLPSLCAPAFLRFPHEMWQKNKHRHISQRQGEEKAWTTEKKFSFLIATTVFFEKLGLAQENYTIETFFRFPSPSTCHSNIHTKWILKTLALGTETESKARERKLLWTAFAPSLRVNAEIKSAAKVPLGKFKKPQQKVKQCGSPIWDRDCSKLELIVEHFLRGKESRISLMFFV